FPDALGTQRIERCRRLGVRHLEWRYVGRGRQRVVGERRGQRGAVLVVDDVLPQRLGDALSRAPVLLTLDEQGIEHPSAVVHRDVTYWRDLTGLGVDLDDRDV